MYKIANLVRCAVGFVAVVALQMPLPAAAALKPDLMFCGSSSRVGANLYLGTGPFTEVSGCAPTATTQALLITRGGTTAGNGAAWLAYLNAGGNIITEWNISAAVYNEIYGTAYANGTWFGQCADNAMPQVKLNPTDPFWVANPIPVTPAGQGGCGYSLSTLVAGQPNVTALGADLGGGVSFARRVQGSGILYLLEADWQDNQASFTNDSRTFMGALISSSGIPTSVAIPTLSQWGMLLLAGLLGLFAFLRLRSREQ